MDPRIKITETNVICPFSHDRPFTVYTPYCFPESDNPFFLPCRGCEHMCGADVCSRCLTYVTLYLNGCDCSHIDTSDFHIV